MLGFLKHNHLTKNVFPHLQVIREVIFDGVNLRAHLVVLAKHHIRLVKHQGLNIVTVDDLLFGQVLQKKTLVSFLLLFVSFCQFLLDNVLCQFCYAPSF